MVRFHMMASLRAGRYRLHAPIASGGMATVHLGRSVGTGGFARTVAIKRLHPHLTDDPDFVTMFLDEARITSRIHHPNVVATLDVVRDEGELLLVMEHVLGPSWWTVLRTAREEGRAIPLEIVSAVLGGILSGLHAAHEARTESGEPLELVHRDVSPQNALVGSDGVARVVDFGIAKAASRVHSTRDGEVKGKLSYMAPEQIRREAVDRRADVYSAGVVLWESLTGERLYEADHAGGVVMLVLEGNPPAPSSIRGDVPPALDELVLRALSLDPAMRPATAHELAVALEAIVPPAPSRTVAAFLMDIAGEYLAERQRLVATFEQLSSDGNLEVAGVPSSSSTVMSLEERRALAAAETAVSVVASAPGAPSSHPPPAARSRRGTVAAAALALLVVMTAFGGYLLRARAVTAGERPSAGEVAPLQPSPPASPPVESVSLSSSPAMTASAAASTASTTEPPSAPSTMPAARRPARRPVPPARRDPRPPRDCKPAYTIDANGVKRFKPWCI